MRLMGKFNSFKLFTVAVWLIIDWGWYLNTLFLKLERLRAEFEVLSLEPLRLRWCCEWGEL